MKTKQMKTSVVSIIAILLLSAAAVGADKPAGVIEFKNAEVTQVLKLYKGLAGRELFVDSQVNMVHAPITLHTTEPLSKPEVMKRIEAALLEQARVVITHLDDKRVSVTFNDALPQPPAKKQPRK